MRSTPFSSCSYEFVPRRGPSFSLPAMQRPTPLGSAALRLRGLRPCACALRGRARASHGGYGGPHDPAPVAVLTPASSQSHRDAITSMGSASPRATRNKRAFKRRTVCHSCRLGVATKGVREGDGGRARSRTRSGAWEGGRGRWRRGDECGLVGCGCVDHRPRSPLPPTRGSP